MKKEEPEEIIGATISLRTFFDDTIVCGENGCYAYEKDEKGNYVRKIHRKKE